MQVSDFISTNKLKKLLRQYSETFDITVSILNANKELVAQFPDGSPQTDLLLKPLSIMVEFSGPRGRYNILCVVDLDAPGGGIRPCHV